MTTVISRLYENEAAARAVETRLRYKMLPRNAFRVYADADDTELLERLDAAGVDKATAQTYAKRVSGGNALVVVRATYKPLGAARIAREALAETNSIDLGDAIQETRVKDGPDASPSVMKDHPRFLTLPSSGKGRSLPPALHTIVAKPQPQINARSPSPSTDAQGIALMDRK